MMLVNNYADSQYRPRAGDGENDDGEGGGWGEGLCSPILHRDDGLVGKQGLFYKHPLISFFVL